MKHLKVCASGCLSRHLRSHLKLRGSSGGLADPVHAVESLWSLSQCVVSLVDVLAMSQRHVTHQQQPRSVCHAGLGVSQNGAEDNMENKHVFTEDD